MAKIDAKIADDIEDDEDDSPEESSGQPLAPAGGNDARAKLYKQLAERAGTTFSPEYRSSVSQSKAALSDQEIKNQLYAGLAQSAAQAGSIGGRVANAQPAAQFAAGLNAQDQQQMQDIAAEGKQGDTDRKALYAYLKEQADREFNATKAKDLQTSRDVKNAETERYHRVLEKQHQDAANAEVPEKPEAHNFMPVTTDQGSYSYDTKTGQTMPLDLPGGLAKLGGPPKPAKAAGDPKAQAALMKDIDNDLATGGRNNKDFKTNQATITSAERLLQLGEQGKGTPGGLQHGQIHEAAMAAAALVSGGTGAAQATVDALVPHTFGGDVAKNVEYWLSQKPEPADQQKFVDLMMETAEREKHLANEKLKGYRADTLNFKGETIKGTPEWESRFKRYVGPNAQYDSNGAYAMQPFVPKTQPGTPESGTAIAAPTPALDPKIAQFAKDNGLEYGQAYSIIENRKRRANGGQ